MDSSRVHIAVLSVSSSNGDVVAMENIVADGATAAGHQICAFETVRDSEVAIRSQLHGFIEDDDIDVVIVLGDGEATSGALKPLVDQPLPGFADLLRMLAFQKVGASAMLSSAEAARCKQTFVFVLPSGEAAVKAAMHELILPQLDPNTKPRNLISSIPRLRDGADVTKADVDVTRTNVEIRHEVTKVDTNPAPAGPARRRSPTGVNVIARKPQQQNTVDDPTKPIELQSLEEQIELSKATGDNTKPLDLGALPKQPPGAKPLSPVIASPKPGTPAAEPPKPRGKPAHRVSLETQPLAIEPKKPAPRLMIVEDAPSAPVRTPAQEPAERPVSSAPVGRIKQPTPARPVPAPGGDQSPTKTYAAVAAKPLGGAKLPSITKPSTAATPSPAAKAPLSPWTSASTPPIGVPSSIPSVGSANKTAADAVPQAIPSSPGTAPLTSPAVLRAPASSSESAAPRGSDTGPLPTVDVSSVVAASSAETASAEEPPSAATSSPPRRAASTPPPTPVVATPASTTPDAPATPVRRPTTPPPTPPTATPPSGTPRVATRTRQPTPPPPPPISSRPSGEMEPLSDEDLIPVAPAVAKTEPHFPLPLAASRTSSPELPAGTFVYPSIKRSRAPLVIGLLLAVAAIGAVLFFVVFDKQDPATPPATSEGSAPVEPEPPAVAAVEIDAGVEVAAVEIDAAPEPAVDDTQSRPTRRATPRPPTSQTRPAPEATTKPVDDRPPASENPALPAPKPDDDPGCDEVSCVLEKYARPCCAKYKPAEQGFQPSSADNLSKPQIKAGIDRIRPHVIDCRAQHASTKGTVKIGVEVGPDGSVQSVSVKESPEDSLGECVATAVRKAKFAQTTNGGSFTYPFVF